ncbi:MAG: hypothetical protein WA118_10130 [Carboxydocellales bacterium]
MGNKSTPAAMDGGRLAAEARTLNRRGLGAFIRPPALRAASYGTKSSRPG